MVLLTDNGNHLIEIEIDDKIAAKHIKPVADPVKTVLRATKAAPAVTANSEMGKGCSIWP